MAQKYLDSTGLAYLWGKLKDYFQVKLVSGTNIKTINNTSLLGSGNINISATGDVADVKVDDVSVVTNGVADIPTANIASQKGVVGIGVTAISDSSGTDGSYNTIELKYESETGTALSKTLATTELATTKKRGLMDAEDKTKLNGIASGAEVNQNAFGNVKVGSTTVAADAKTDTLELVAGSNVTLTPDATNDKVTIAATDTTYSTMTDAEYQAGTDTTNRLITPARLINAIKYWAVALTDKYTRSSVGHLDWSNQTDGNAKVIAKSALAFWNGCYSGTNSNLTYCNKGAFGTLATKNSLSASDVGALPSNYFIFDTYSKSITVSGGATSVTMGALTQHSGYTLRGYINQNGGYTDQWLVSYGTYGSNVVAMVYSKYNSSLTNTISCIAIWTKNL